MVTRMARLADLELFPSGDFTEYAQHLEFFFTTNDIGIVPASASSQDKVAANRKQACSYIIFVKSSVQCFEGSVFTGKAV